MGAQPALLGLDLGTTAVKAGLFAPDGRELGVAACEYQARSPEPGWQELDSGTYRLACVEAVQSALARAGAVQVLAIGLSSQGQTFVPLDSKLQPLCPAIVWLDTRSQQQAQRLRAMLDPVEYTRRTGLLFPSAIETASKLLWLREMRPDLWSRIGAVVMLPDLMSLWLTGQRVLDRSNAASTGLFDAQASRWWEQAVAAIGAQTGWFSPIGEAGQVVGLLREEPAAELGLPAGIPITLGANDQVCGALGVGNVLPGLASGAIGTALAILATTAAPSTHPGLLSARHAVPGLWTTLCYAKNSGVLLTWLRDRLGLGGSYDSLVEEAQGVPVGCEGLVCLPHFSGTATPSFRSDVTGGFLGLTLGHTRAHVIRAVIEAVCFEALDAVTNMQAAGDRIQTLRMLGGATHSPFWMQCVADALGLPLELPFCPNAAVLGAAECAGLGAGVYSSLAEASTSCYRARVVFEPRAQLRTEYAAAYARYRTTMQLLYPGALD